MVKYIEESQSYQYFDDEGNRIFLKNISCKQAKDIIMQLMMCDDFIADSNIFHSLLIGIRKLEGFSDEDIERLR